FAFIMGVVPLIIASGAGAEMRRVMGIAVFSGMLGVTFLGLVFTPLFYVLVRGVAAKAHLPAHKGGIPHGDKPVAIPDDVQPLRPWIPPLAASSEGGGGNHV
ncbi:MAG TPA: efflux RND transporter permease subunit, partial [Gemmatimonadaceae bacterium]|nr:efflux RND transporter permease subunit [Gemmatimonadaceae bacterium]